MARDALTVFKMAKESDKAKEYYRTALDQSRSAGIEEGVSEAQTALRRLG